MEQATTATSAAASAGSKALDRSGDDMAATDRSSTCSSASVAAEHMAPRAETKRKGSSAGFRKFREALIAKKFESQDNVPVEVEAGSGLFIGSYGSANNLQALKSAAITHIVCVSPSLPLQFPEHFTYYRLAVADVPSACIADVFDDALSFIDSALMEGGKVLVHCFMGRSRSATIVLAHLISRQKLTLSDALCKLRLVRPQAQPNSGFYKELVAFEAAQSLR